MTRRLDFCAFENRPSEFVALKLLARSLERNAPDARLHVFSAPLPPAMVQWLAERPNVALHPAPSPKGTEWDIKPELLLWLLDHGVPAPIWIDTDIIVARRLPRVLTHAAPDCVVAAEEPRLFWPRGARVRAIDLGLEPRADGADFELNGGLLRFSGAHRLLLNEWQRILSLPAYVDAKKYDFIERPIAFQSDQTVLCGLLGSQRFAEVPVALLRESRDIAQCKGYTGYRRWARLLNTVRGTPPFIHAMSADKPWRPREAPNTWVDLAPNRLAALPYIDKLSPDERLWLQRETPRASLLRRLFFDHPDLCGLPIALKNGGFGRADRFQAHPRATAAELLAEGRG